MKKILLVATLFAMSAIANAQQQQLSGTGSSSTSTAISSSVGLGGQGGTAVGVGGQGGTASVSGNCIGTCVDQTASTALIAESQISIANIQAQSARDIASIQGQAARDVAGTTVTVKNVPSVSAPALTSSNDTCMGSTSGSLNIAGLGLGGGTSWVDTNCKMLKNSRELWNMGMKGAAIALMCTDATNKEALELSGFVCPQTERANKVATAASVGNTEPTDPIVRARLGLPALK